MAISGKGKSPKSAQPIRNAGSGGYGNDGRAMSGAGGRAGGASAASGRANLIKANTAIQKIRAKQNAKAADKKMITAVARGGSIKPAPSAAEAAKAAKQHIVDLQRANNNTRTFSPSLGSKEISYIKANEKKIAQLEKLVKKWSK